MPKVAVYDMHGAQVGEIELNDNVFGIEPNEAVMYRICKDAARQQAPGNLINQNQN